MQQVDSCALLALVQQAAVVLQHLPSAPADDCPLGALANAHTGSTNLLCTVAAYAIERAEPVRREVVQPLLPTLPQLAAALQLAVTLRNGRVTKLLCSYWTGLLKNVCIAVLMGANPSPPPGQWLAAVTDMLRLLPTAAACRHQFAQPSDNQAAAQVGGRQSVVALGKSLLDAAKAFLCQVQPDECEPQLVAAAQEAHEACCRAIHWAAASPDAQLLLVPGEGGPLKALLGMVGLAANMIASAHSSHAREPAAPLRCAWSSPWLLLCLLGRLCVQCLPFQHMWAACILLGTPAQ